MAVISYRPNLRWSEGRYLVEVVDEPIHLQSLRCTLWGARRAARRLERQAARRRRRLQRVEEMRG